MSPWNLISNPNFLIGPTYVMSVSPANQTAVISKLKEDKDKILYVTAFSADTITVAFSPHISWEDALHHLNKFQELTLKSRDLSHVREIVIEVPKGKELEYADKFIASRSDLFRTALEKSQDKGVVTTNSYPIIDYSAYNACVEKSQVKIGI